MQDRYVYPAFFCYDLPGQVGVVFPDLPGCVSQGDDDTDALRMAKEALSLHLYGMERDGDDIPDPTSPLKLSPDEDQAVVLIDVFMPVFRERMNDRTVKKVVFVPSWLALEAENAKLDFSQILQDELMDRLGIQREITRSAPKISNDKQVAQEVHHA